MRQMLSLSLLALIIALQVSFPAVSSSGNVEEERAEIRTMAKETLQRLYDVHPSAKGQINSASGYAVFSNFGTKIFVMGGGTGKGIAVNRETEKEIYMKMVEVQAGLGFGVKKFSVIFVFETQKALNEFVNQGWEFGGQGTAAAKVEDEGGGAQVALSVSPGVWMYQLTETGLAAELTGKGTKYYRDDDLN